MEETTLDITYDIRRNEIKFLKLERKDGSVVYVSMIGFENVNDTQRICEYNADIIFKHGTQKPYQFDSTHTLEHFHSIAATTVSNYYKVPVNIKVLRDVTETNLSSEFPSQSLEEGDNPRALKKPTKTTERDSKQDKQIKEIKNAVSDIESKLEDQLRSLKARKKQSFSSEQEKETEKKHLLNKIKELDVLQKRINAIKSSREAIKNSNEKIAELRKKLSNR